jgi:hypothetical protein
MLPDTLTIPVEALLIPYPPAAVTLPVTITVPVELFSIPKPPAPDVTLPDMIHVPVDKLPISLPEELPPYKTASYGYCSSSTTFNCINCRWIRASK